MPSSTASRTVRVGSSSGSCGRKPMRRLGMGVASPSYSRSTPAMILSRLDLPEPLSPSTPIFAPEKKDSEMSLRITRLGGTSLPTRFMVYTYCAIGGPQPKNKRRARLWQVLALSRHSQFATPSARRAALLPPSQSLGRLLARSARRGCRGRRRQLAGAALRGLCRRLSVGRGRTLRVGHDFVPTLLNRVVLSRGQTPFFLFLPDKDRLPRQLVVDRDGLVVEFGRNRLAGVFCLLL